MADPVAAAVADVEKRPQTVRMVRREFTSTVTGRPIAIEYPVRLAAAGIVLPTGVPADLRRT